MFWVPASYRGNWGDGRWSIVDGRSRSDLRSTNDQRCSAKAAENRRLQSSGRAELCRRGRRGDSGIAFDQSHAFNLAVLIHDLLEDYSSLRLTPRFDRKVGLNAVSQPPFRTLGAVSYTHLRAHETRHDLVCRLL